MAQDNTKGRIAKRWINLDPNDPASLTANDIPYDEYKSIQDVVDQKIDQGAPIAVSRVGDLLYLPLDIKSSFTANAVTANSRGYFLCESDGSYIGLRPAYDGIKHRLVYCYSLSGDTSKLYLTDIEYRPAFLTATQYLSEVIVGNKYGFLAIQKDTADSTIANALWIPTNGTLNAKYHSNYTSITISGVPVVYCPEKNLFLGIYINTNTVTLNIYDGTSQDFIKSLPLFNITDSSNCVISNYNGAAYTSIVYNIAQPYCNIQYSYDEQEDALYIYSIVTLRVVYPNDLFDGHVVIRQKIYYDSVQSEWTNEPLDKYPLSYDPTTSSDPIYPSSKLGLCNIALYEMQDTSSDSIAKAVATVEYYNDITKFTINKYDIAKVENSSLLNSDKTSIFDYVLGDTSNPFQDITESNYLSDSTTYIPTDACLLGKNVYSLRCCGDSNFLVDTKARLSSDNELTSRTVKVELDLSSRQTIVDANDGLLPPSTITDYSKKNISLCETYIITSANDQYGVHLDIDGNAVKKVDINTDETLPVLVLPSNFEDQVKAKIWDDPDASGYNTTYCWIYYLGEQYFIVTYILWDSVSSHAYEIKFCVMELTTSQTVNVVSQYVPISSGSTNDPSDIGTVKPSSGSYVDLVTGVIRAIFIAYPKSDNNIFSTSPIIISFDPSAGSVKYEVLDLIDGTKYPIATVNSLLGPIFTYSTANLSRILAHYIDKTDETDLATRLQDAFDTWLTSTTPPNELYLLTIKAPEGFIVYLPEAPVFIRGYERKLNTQSVNLADKYTDPSNQTFYLYLELAQDGLITKVSSNKLVESYTRMQLATINTDSSKIDNIEIRPSTRVGFYTPSQEPIPYGIPITDTNGIVDRKWFPTLVESSQHQYYPASNPQNSVQLFRNIQSGVAQLVEVTSQLYNIRITFPKKFTNPPLVLASLTNAADGYTGSGGLDSITSWVRFEVCNITEEQCTLSLSIGEPASGLTIFAHWFALGN